MHKTGMHFPIINNYVNKYLKNEISKPEYFKVAFDKYKKEQKT